MFTFQIDRFHKATKPITLYGNVDLSGETFTLAEGEKAVYRGVVELAGKQRHVFVVGEKKGYSSDRAALEAGLEECYDELIQV
jgi:hypothetical protein